MKPTELPYTIIELTHDIKRRYWGIPLGDGKYYYISEQALEYTYDLREICEYVNKQYGIDIPFSAYEAMKNMRDHTAPFVHVPHINPVAFSDTFAGKSRHIPSLYLY
jgi:hypothetical protein